LGPPKSENFTSRDEYFTSRDPKKGPFSTLRTSRKRKNGHFFHFSSPQTRKCHFSTARPRKHHFFEKMTGNGRKNDRFHSAPPFARGRCVGKDGNALWGSRGHRRTPQNVHFSRPGGPKVHFSTPRRPKVHFSTLRHEKIEKRSLFHFFDLWTRKKSLFSKRPKFNALSRELDQIQRKFNFRWQ